MMSLSNAEGEGLGRGLFFSLESQLLMSVWIGFRRIHISKTAGNLSHAQSR